MGTLTLLIIFAAFVVAVIFAAQKRWKAAGIAGAVCILLVILDASISGHAGVSPYAQATPLDQTPVNHDVGPGGCTGPAC